MSRRPDIGYFDSGKDLLDPGTWLDPGRHAASDKDAPVDPLVFRSLEFAYLEDEAIWTRDWIGMGTLADLVGEGDILSFTAGNHGVHVQRMADGGLVGRFNNAQHGGCRVVPVQCQQGVKTKCSFTSCGYSRDRTPMARGAAGEATPEMYQYTGLRPERLLPISIGLLGPVVLGNLDGAGRHFDLEPELADWLAGCPGGWASRRQVVWEEYPANWKLYGEALFGLIDPRPMGDGQSLYASGQVGGACVGAAWSFPNILMLCSATASAVVVVQPTALDRVMTRIELFGDGAADPGLLTLCRDAGWAAAALQLRIGETDEASPARRWMQSRLIDRILSMPRVEPQMPLFQGARFYRI